MGIDSFHSDVALDEYIIQNKSWLSNQSMNQIYVWPEQHVQNCSSKCFIIFKKAHKYRTNKSSKSYAPLFSVGCIDLYCPFNMSLGVWQNDPRALWESQRFSHISLSDWWETPPSVLLLTLKINNKLLCARSRVSVSSRRDAPRHRFGFISTGLRDLGFYVRPPV